MTTREQAAHLNSILGREGRILTDIAPGENITFVNLQTGITKDPLNVLAKAGCMHLFQGDVERTRRKGLPCLSLVSSYVIGEWKGTIHVLRDLNAPQPCPE